MPTRFLQASAYIPAARAGIPAAWRALSVHQGDEQGTCTDRSGTWHLADDDTPGHRSIDGRLFFKLVFMMITSSYRAGLEQIEAMHVMPRIALPPAHQYFLQQITQ